MTPPATGHSGGASAGVFLLALTLVLAPALGVHHEEMLQDTLKSIVVSLGVLLAACVYLWSLRSQPHTLLWHDALWLPVLLLLYALGSMLWSHAYLAGSEAARWFVLAVLAWLVASTVTREHWPLLAAGIHTGAVLASVWAALQFWFNFGLFPQGPAPASTFLNRNFLAEYLVASLPFGIYLLVQAQTSRQIRRLSVSVGWCVLALLMTGTRSALITLALLGLALPFVLHRLRGQLALAQWTRGQRVASTFLLAAVVLGLGGLSSSHPGVLAEHGPAQPVSALSRTVARAVSLGQASEYSNGSFAVRTQLWAASVRMIQDHPLTGVGSGAWEVAVPLYQPSGTLIEIDYYAHNDILQLLAECGVAGWVFLAGLFTYWGLSVYRTCCSEQEDDQDDRAQRVTALASIATVLLTSAAGFPLHMACTGSLLAVSLGLLVVSDARRAHTGLFVARRLVAQAWVARWLLGAGVATLALATYIAYQAQQCEQKIVRAVSMALHISASGMPQHPGWNPAKAQMLQLISEGIAINPHYRKITPLLADELGRWGDWANAAVIWESVLASRPNIAGLYLNVARARLYLHQNDLAAAAYERARLLQPNAPEVRAFEAML